MKVVNYGGRNEDTERFDGASCDYETDKALHCTIGTKQLWVPKSVVDDDSEVYAKGHRGTLVVKHWWAEKQGLV